MTASDRAIVIGASAGALEALTGILPSLPSDYPFPVMIVVHFPPDKSSVATELLQAKCRVQVKEAEDKEPLVGGTVYFAPPNYHLLVEKEKILSLSNEEPVLHSRPSIDVLFETAAEAYGEALIGIVLSGANQDGSRGLKMIIEAGGTGLVLQPELAYAAAMLRAALDACPEAQALSLQQIAEYLEKVGGA